MIGSVQANWEVYSTEKFNINTIQHWNELLNYSNFIYVNMECLIIFATIKIITFELYKLRPCRIRNM